MTNWSGHPSRRILRSDHELDRSSAQDHSICGRRTLADSLSGPSEAKGGGTNSIEKTSVASGAINCLAASAEGASMRFDRRRLVSFDR